MTGITNTPLPWPSEEILDIAALDEPSAWLVVGRDGSVRRFDADSAGVVELDAIELPPDESERPAWKQPASRAELVRRPGRRVLQRRRAPVFSRRRWALRLGRRCRCADRAREGFTPTKQHRAGRELVALSGATLLRSRL